MQLNLFSFKSFQPFWDITYDTFEKANTVILGHFTTSNFLEQILKEGLKPAHITGNFANDDMLSPGDEYYTYFAAHYDRQLGENSVEKFGGDTILILTEINKSSLELDDLRQKYSNQNINMKNQKEIFKALTKDCFAQCRVKDIIKPSQILKVLKVPSNEVIYER